jgi:hypothetical protein
MDSLVSFKLRNHPWENPDPSSGVMPGAADGWLLPDGSAMVFHTTTQLAAESIIRGGFKPSQELEVGGHPWAGIPGRIMPAGIWCSIRPTVPNDSDIWLPDVCAHPWAVVAVRISMEVISRRTVFEHTWPVVQLCLKPEDIHSVALLAPDDMPGLIHPVTVQKISGFRSEYHLPSPYLDSIDAAARALIADHHQALQEVAA